MQPPAEELSAFYQTARHVLKHPLLTFSDDDIQFLGKCFGQVVRDREYVCYACAIMPDHVHLLIRRHRDKAEEMIAALQEFSRFGVLVTDRRPVDHPVWGGPGWKVFLNTCEDIERVIEYIRQNPIKAGRPEQRWDFVQKYDGWLPTRFG